MSKMIQWLVQDDSTQYLIEYAQTLPGNKAKLVINGAVETCDLWPDADQGYTAAFTLGSKNCRLQVSLDGAGIDLFVNDQLQSRLELPETIPSPVSGNDSPAGVMLQKRIKSGMSSFLTLIVLSLINLVLIWLNASISFPFSIFSSAVAFSFGQAFSEEYGTSLFLIIGIIISILVIAIYAVLYKLAARRTWPIWTALGLIGLDTLLLIVFALMDEDLISYLLDLAFHVWIIASLVRLGQSRLKFNRLMRGNADIQTASEQMPIQTPSA